MRHVLHKLITWALIFASSAAYAQATVSPNRSLTGINDMKSGTDYLAPSGDISGTSFTATGGTTTTKISDFVGQRLNVKALYGAKGDTLVYTTAAATAGSSTITSSTGFFTASMVGKALVVSGSGTGGIPQVGTVTAFNSITSITASFTAVTSISPTTILIGTDDTAAFLSMMNAMQNSFAKPVTGYIPTGSYFVRLGSFPVLNRGAIVCDGPAQSLVYMDPSTSGDLFAFSETWGSFASAGQITGEGGDIPTTNVGRSGSGVVGCGIRGSKTAFAGDQNAIVFYDRNDSVRVRDVLVKNVVGACLSIGKTKAQPQAYVRESQNLSLSCFYSGSSTQPSVYVGSTTVSGSDASNQIYFDNLDVFASASNGLVIDNPNGFNATRQIDFKVLRVEASAGDNIVIGSATGAGQVANITAKETHTINPGFGAAGFWGIKVYPPTNLANNHYNIDFGATYLFSPTSNGIDIEGGSIITASPKAMAVVSGGTHLKVGASVQGSVFIDSRGDDKKWVLDLNPATAKYLVTNSLPKSSRLNGNFLTGRFYGPDTYSAPTNQALTQANRLWVTPMFVPSPSLLKTLSFNIGTGNTAAWNARMCVYADTGTGLPGNLVPNGDTGTVAIASGSVTGIQTANVNSTTGVWLAGPAWYWIGFMADSTGESLFSHAGGIGAASGNLNNQIGYNTAAQLYAGTSSIGYYQSQTFGACPSTFSTSPIATTGQGGVPYILLGF